MPRKRKSDQTPTADITTPAAEQPAPEAGTAATAVAEPPAVEPPQAEARPDSQGFAERVGQKKRAGVADPFGIAKDNLAGVRLFESKEDRQMAIKFGSGGPEDKPSQAVIDKMKEAGYRWNMADRIWTYPVRPDSAMSTRIDAETLYQEVRQMIRQEKGIEATQDVPF
jgi:hypothetical protein